MKKKIIIPIVAAVIATVILMVVIRNSEDDRKTIPVSGTIEITDVELSFKVPGRMAERLVDEGEMVRAGQVVARLEQDDYIHEVTRLRKEVLAQQAELVELQRGSREEEIAQADAAVERSKSELERAESDYKRQQELYRKDVISAREFESAKAAYDVARARLREAQEQQSLVRKGPRVERIERAQARLQEARAGLRGAETRLGHTTLISPATGLVLSKNAEPGEQVAVGTPIVTVGNMNDTWLRAYISETDLGRIRVGQRATVTTDTFPDKKYEGKITFISSEAEFTPKSVQTEKERVKLVYRIKIAVPNPQMELKPGMPADAEILLQQQN